MSEHGQTQNPQPRAAARTPTPTPRPAARPDASAPAVRGRCACGRRFRVRNAFAGATVRCPACGRAISITPLDLAAAAHHDAIAPLVSDTSLPLEAELIEAGELRIAPDGSRVGRTGREVYDHDEARMVQALGAYGIGRDIAIHTPLVSQRDRALLKDALRGVWFAGQPRTALNVLFTGFVCGLVLAGVTWYPATFMSDMRIIWIVVATIGVVLYSLRCLMTVLERSAAGDDDVPIFDSTFDGWDDVVRPSLHLGLTSALLLGPALVLAWAPGFEKLPAPLNTVGAPTRSALAIALGLGGGLLWPVAIMNVVIWQTLGALRPDRLWASLQAIGLIYLPTALFAMLVLAGWVVVVGSLWSAGGSPQALLTLPLIWLPLNLYLGYILFRTLGLLHRYSAAAQESLS